MEDLLKEYPKRLTLVDLDVGQSSSVQRAAEQVKAELSAPDLDMLINCAGISQNKGREEAIRTVNVNSLGAIRMVEAFLSLMEQGEKRVFPIASQKPV